MISTTSDFRRGVLAALVATALLSSVPAVAFDGEPMPLSPQVDGFAGAPAQTAPGVSAPAAPAAPAAPTAPGTYSQRELVKAGHAFFGQASGGLATMIESLLSRFGEPTGYILGEEGSGAFIGGLRYGEGELYTRTMGTHRVYWQGPSVGWDFGGAGSRVMMLVYELPSVQTLMQRFTGVEGSAYVVAGLSMTVMAADTTYLVPVRTGVGAKLGINLGYLKFTQRPTWNPF